LKTDPNPDEHEKEIGKLLQQIHDISNIRTNNPSYEEYFDSIDVGENPFFLSDNVRINAPNNWLKGLICSGEYKLPKIIRTLGKGFILQTKYIIYAQRFNTKNEIYL